ncbi:MAG: histidine kinase [Xanthomonadales bacterium]|nr:histidine kinase [Xanthomonadales bacterium]
MIRMSISLMKMSRKRQFWILHITGWLAWGAYKYLYTTGVLGESIPNYLTYVLVITGIGMLISFGLRLVYKLTWERAIWIRGLAFAGGSLGAGWLWLQSRSFIYTRYIQSTKEMSDYWENLGDVAELFERVSYLQTYSSALSVMLAWSVIYFSVKYYRIFQEYRESALRSAAMAHEAQLKMLRYQLNPHFLFNTLNAISTLILERQIELANRMVSKLSSFLRFSLDNDPMQKITLRQELKALRLYLEIEKVRFEEHLGMKFEIDEDAQAALIPSLLLQPLVENAIKYAIAKSEDGGNLRIAAKVFAGDLLIEVSDDGPGVEIVDGQIPGASGVGLRNTRERLQELYGAHHSFRLSNAEPHGLVISIRIPFETGQETAPPPVD